MRFVSSLLVVVLCLGLIGCGGDSGPAGVWVVDMEAMKPHLEPMQKEAREARERLKGTRKMLKEQLKNMTPQQREMLEKTLGSSADKMLDESTEDAIENPFGSTKATLSGDGTFKVESDGKVDFKGTWKLDGDKITFTTTEMNGRKVQSPTTNTGIYTGSQIKYKEPGMPYEMIFKRGG